MRYYTSNTTFIAILIGMFYIAEYKFYPIVNWVNKNMLNSYITNLINTNNIDNFTYLMLILFIPLILVALLFIGLLSLNIVSYNTEAKKLQDENMRIEVKEFFIVKLFRNYAYIIEKVLNLINYLLFFFIILNFFFLLGRIALYNLGFVVDLMFDTSWMIWSQKGKDIIVFNFSFFLCLIPIYSVLLLKIIYVFYINTNFPVPSLSKINLTSWINIFHSKLNNDKHIASVLDSLFENYIIDGKEGIGFYLKRFELGSIGRILFVILFKNILRVFYFITRPILILFKAKYFYYLSLPFVYLITFSFNFILSIAFNIIKYLVAFISFSIYISQVFAWIIVSILMLGVILLINTIAFETVLIDYTNLSYLVSNIAAFLYMNTFSALIVYIIIPEFSFYSNPLTIKNNFVHNLQSLNTNSERKRTFIFLFISITLVFISYYFVIDFILNKYNITSYQVVVDYFINLKEFLTIEYKDIIDYLLNYLR